MSVALPEKIQLVYVKTCRRYVAAAGTPEPFETGNPAFYRVLSVTIRAYTTNTDNLYLGDSNRVSATDYSYILAPGESVSLSAGQDAYGKDRYIDLTKMWIDADTNDNGCCFIALVDAAAW